MTTIWNFFIMADRWWLAFTAAHLAMMLGALVSVGCTAGLFLLDRYELRRKKEEGER